MKNSFGVEMLRVSKTRLLFNEGGRFITLSWLAGKFTRLYFFGHTWCKPVGGSMNYRFSPFLWREPKRKTEAV